MMLAKKKILGDYHIGKTIGQGAFSKVKIGYHIETGQKVAIKVIDKRQMEAKAKKAKQAHEDRERRRRSDDKGRKEKEVEKGTGSDIPGGVETGKTSSFVSSLQTEVQLLMRLDHPNVIRLYQVMESEDECFVVMEYASGGELIDYIAAKGNLTEKEARRFFRQMVSALDHCHQANVVHRDLK
ncbi:Serine/threonine-protein kinase par-1 [Nowakowskiella sp. JEL0407]|nr:Serine/threonine-protein kinase par-1 [Nowakowskiella sp. JEL0407]